VALSDLAHPVQKSFRERGLFVIACDKFEKQAKYQRFSRIETVPFAAFSHDA
jgi:hypothetical protein